MIIILGKQLKLQVNILNTNNLICYLVLGSPVLYK